MSITSPSKLQRTIGVSSGRGMAEIIIFFLEQGNVYMKGEKKTYVIGTTTANNESGGEDHQSRSPIQWLLPLN